MERIDLVKNTAVEIDIKLIVSEGARWCCKRERERERTREGRGEGVRSIALATG